jgi:hypothetical protein
MERRAVDVQFGWFVTVGLHRFDETFVLVKIVEARCVLRRLQELDHRRFAFAYPSTKRGANSLSVGVSSTSSLVARFGLPLTSNTRSRVAGAAARPSRR